MRGHPGSGKTTLIDLVLNEETKYNAQLPKVFNFDEYLNNQKKMNEFFKNLNRLNELNASQSSFDNIVNCKKFLFDDFSRAIKERQFQFVIFNSINQKVQDFENYFITSKLNGYSTYIAEMDFIDYQDIPESRRQDLTYEEWQEISKNWELTPSSYIRLKVNNFMLNKQFRLDNFQQHHQQTITVLPSNSKLNENQDSEQDDFSIRSKETFSSKINLNDNLVIDKLDDFRMKRRRPIEEFWSLPNNYYQRKNHRLQDQARLLKRVRWLDVESKKIW